MPFQWTLYQKRMHTGALIFTKALNEGMKYEETPRHAPDMVHLTDVNKQMNGKQFFVRYDSCKAKGKAI